MDFLRNKEVRLQIMLCIGVTVIGSVLSYFFCMKFYWVTFLTGCAITAISLIFTYRRYMKISSLSQDIDRLLHGEESIRFDDYGEGELAVLENEISKMTLRLLVQSGQLQKDKKYLADSLADISHQLKTPLTSLEILNAALSQEGIDFEQQTSVYKGYKQDKIEMRGDRAEMSDFPLYLNTVAGGLDCRDQTIGGFSFVVKIYALPVVEIIG